MSEPRVFPPLNLYEISFPSDNLTLGYARKHDQSEGMGTFSSSERLTEASRAYDVLTIIPLCYEMELAEKTYAKCLGLADPRPGTPRSELVALLRDEWKKHGISQGNQHSTQLIRDIELAAKRQADRQLGKGR